MFSSSNRLHFQSVWCTQHISKIRRKNVQVHRLTGKHTPILGLSQMNVSVLWKGKKKTFNGIFVLWAFTLKGGKDCYDSETFTVMGHNPWKHLGRLGYCPWTSSPFNLHSYSFGNFIHLKYHLCNEDSYICICNLEHSPEFETHKITWLLDIYIWTAVRNPNVNISKETELLILFLFQTGSTLIHSRFHF